MEYLSSTPQGYQLSYLLNPLFSCFTITSSGNDCCFDVCIVGAASSTGMNESEESVFGLLAKTLSNDT